jgi:hypothetical protein
MLVSKQATNSVAPETVGSSPESQQPADASYYSDKSGWLVGLVLQRSAALNDRTLIVSDHVIYPLRRDQCDLRVLSS